MKIIKVQLLHAARDWNSRTTNRITFWTNGKEIKIVIIVKKGFKCRETTCVQF